MSMDDDGGGGVERFGLVFVWFCLLGFLLFFIF